MGDWRVILNEAATNKVLNPVAQSSSNYAAVSSAITLSTTYSYLGYKSFHVVCDANNDGITFTLSALANEIHYITVRMRGTIDPAWKWSLNGSTWHAPDLLGTEGDWSVYGHQIGASEASGSTTLYIYQNGAGASDFYLGHVQVEQNTYATTPITGEIRGFCSDGYYWNGTPHASASTRAAKERSGGLEVDLRTSYNFSVKYGIGLGMPPITHHTQGMALLPGALYQGHKIQPRALDLVSTTEISTVAGIHAARKNFLNAVKPDRVSPEQPVVFRYYGANANKPVEFYGYYDSGMEFNLSDGRIDQPVARFICYDPYAYEIGEGAALLTSSVSRSYFSVAAKIAGAWYNLGPVSAGGAGYCSLFYNGILYVCLNSIDINGIAAADYVAKYASGAWAAIGASGFNVYASWWKVGPDGTFWAGGGLTTMVGTTVNYIGKSADSGATWATAGGTSCDAAVSNLAWDLSGNMYICGNFTKTPDNISATRIAKSTNGGTIWAAMGSGLNAKGDAIAVSPANEVYVCGLFTTANGVTVNYLARWTGSTFATVGGTSCNQEIQDMCFDPAGNLYIVGAFTVAPDGTAAAGIAMWNGKAWVALGTGIGTGCKRVFYNKGLIYACGTITTAGGAVINSNVAVWNGSTWHSLDFSAATTVQDIQFTANGDIYLIMADAAAANMISSIDMNATNNGSTVAYPEIHIKRAGGTSASVSYLKNETTGATLWLSYDLLNGEELTIRTQPTERTITSSFFGTVWRAILRESDFSEFNLQSGVNNISLLVIPTGSPTVTAWAQWRTPHLGADMVAT